MKQRAKTNSLQLPCCSCMFHVHFCFSIDATYDDGSLGRLINDSKYFPNATMKKVMVDDTPYLCVFACEDIGISEEIMYSYGDDLAWHKEVMF